MTYDLWAYTSIVNNRMNWLKSNEDTFKQPLG